MESSKQPPAKYFLAPDNPEFDKRFSPIKFAQPADWSSTIWRYMTIGKFLSLLKEKALFFARLDKFDDSYEGSRTWLQKAWQQRSNKLRQEKGLPPISPLNIESIIQNTIVNCWHMRDYESVPMWERYVKGEGVTIQSTYERLSSSFDRFDGSEQQRNEDGTDLHLFVRIGMVKYIDYRTYRGPIEGLGLLKRLNYEDEREVRAIVMDRSLMRDGRPTRFPTGGDCVGVDLAKLIEVIYIAPRLPQLLKSSVESLVKQYGFDFPVKESELDSEPIR